ncbi:MAG: lipid-A-disaccharide synthase [Candidatus Lambdaproteobacteria bacterium]|nr:lipid-A-disaccharide synthase [Candidatus Lambdaproteobacteria bacterium]
MKLMVTAGELSGDSHGGALLAALRLRLPALEAIGIGGPRMLAEGLRPLFPLEALQVHGLVEVVRHLPRLYRLLWSLEQALRRERPAALLTIDYPGFNLKLAGVARRLGIPVVHYSAPQVWAWRRGRIRAIARSVDTLITLFPFEQALFRAAGVDARFLGHPLVGQAATDEEAAALRARIGAQLDAQLGGDAGLPIVAVMPGSRPSEIARNLPPLLAALARIERAGYRACYVLPLAPNLDRGPVAARVAAGAVAVLVEPGAFLPLLRLASLALVASGTATLQVAMAGIPFVTVYRVAGLSFWLARRFAYVRHISIVNILAGREVVPELLQHDFTPERVCRTFLALAREPARQAAMRADLLAVTATLGAPGAYERAADLIAGKLSAAREPGRQAAPAPAPAAPPPGRGPDAAAARGRTP